MDNGGFKFKSLTEDLEMEIEIIKKGGRILWNDFTSIYDEKPEKTKIGLIQRHRWIKGHWYVAFKEVLPLLYKFVSTLQMKYLDKILFLMTMGKALHIFLILILLTVIGIMTAIFSGLEYLIETANVYSVLSLINEYFLYIYGFNLLLILYSFGFLPVYSAYRRMGKHNFIKIFFALQWYMITDLLVQFIGLFTWHRQGVWVRTPHEKEELEVDKEILAMPDTVDETISNIGEGLVNKQEKISKV